MSQYSKGDILTIRTAIINLHCKCITSVSQYSKGDNLTIRTAIISLHCKCITSVSPYSKGNTLTLRTAIINLHCKCITSVSQFSKGDDLNFRTAIMPHLHLTCDMYMEPVNCSYFHFRAENTMAKRLVYGLTGYTSSNIVFLKVGSPQPINMSYKHCQCYAGIVYCKYDLTTSRHFASQMYMRHDIFIIYLYYF